MHAEWRLIAPHVAVIIPLGGFAWQIALRLLADQITSKPKPKFGHGASVTLTSGATLLGCFHPSQQNMFTGRLTPAMLDDIFGRAAELAGTSGPGGTL